MSEHRVAPRTPMDRPIILHLSDGETVRAHLINLSVGGVGVVYPAPAPKGAKFGVSFQISTRDGPYNITAKGVVQHCHIRGTDYAIGIEFTEISEDLKKTIAQYVEYKRTNNAAAPGFMVSHRAGKS